MPDTYQDVFFIISYGVAIVLLGSLAAWKHRNPWAWGLIAGLFFPTSLICLLLESHLCPHCKRSLTAQEWKRRKCPSCGPLRRRMKPHQSFPALMHLNS